LRTTITLPLIPPEWTRGIDTGLLLVVLIASEILSIRRFGITPSVESGSLRPHIDYMGHLAGYATGIGAGAVIRSTHPKYKRTLEREVSRRHPGSRQQFEVKVEYVLAFNDVFDRPEPSISNFLVTNPISSHRSEGTGDIRAHDVHEPNEPSSLESTT